MGHHDRAWTGLGILVYGATPLAPMRLEQAISAASPGNEIRVDSFEDYGDAYEHTKNAKNVGFIFLFENCGQAQPTDVFKQLAKSYESQGWPCFGILIHENGESLAGHRALRTCPGILGYHSKEEFSDSDRTRAILGEVWEKYVSAFESAVLPQPLQSTFLSLVSDRLPAASVQFCDRVGVILSSSLNVSWLESVALRWTSVVRTLEKCSPKALESHGAIVQICNLAQGQVDESDLLKIVASNASLCSRIRASVEYLDKCRIEGSLADRLQELATNSKPGAPALLRHIASAKAKINAVAFEIQSAERAGDRKFG